MNKRKKWGVALIILPFALFVGILILQIVARFMFSGVGESGPIEAFINIVTILGGMVMMLGFLPSIIVGIVLLATPGKQQAQSQVSKQQPEQPTAPQDPYSLQ